MTRREAFQHRGGESSIDIGIVLRPHGHGSRTTIIRMAAPPTIDIACLCAAWCRLCDDYAPVFDAAVAELGAAGLHARRHWIDIEDEAALIDDVDVETFPTLVVIGPDGVRFAGPLTPQPEILRRMLRATVLDAQEGESWPAATPELRAFASRLRLRADE